mmetsp:Transcript_1602/g.2204  ORF Transcript_1602/g.2204 Transcript_1602/m.2204 type:complete len:86 (+) Transcript_1602:591-848(+)
MSMMLRAAGQCAMSVWALGLQNAVSAWEVSMSSFQKGGKNLIVRCVIKVETRCAANAAEVAGLQNGLNLLNSSRNAMLRNLIQFK